MLKVSKGKHRRSADTKWRTGSKESSSQDDVDGCRNQQARCWVTAEQQRVAGGSQTLGRTLQTLPAPILVAGSNTQLEMQVPYPIKSKG